MGSIIALRRVIPCRYTVAITKERVVLCGLLVVCRVFFPPVVTMSSLRRQCNTGRSVTVRRGIVTTGQVILRLSCSVAFKNLFSLFVDVFPTLVPRYDYPFVWQTSRTLVRMTLYVYMLLVQIYPTYTQSKNTPDSGILQTIIIVNSYA